MKRDNEQGTICGRHLMRAGALVAVIGIAMAAEAQQQYGTDTAASGQQQDDLFTPPAGAQSGQLQRDVALEGAAQSQPPTGLEDQTSGQPGALDERGGLSNQNTARQPSETGRQDARYQEGELDPLSPTRDRPQDTQRGLRDERQPMAQGERGELGVFLTSIDGRGVTIGEVVTGSAADQAGLEPGDIILEIGGQAVASPSEVSQLIRQISAGEVANLLVSRDGREGEVAATLLAARDRRAVGFRGEPSMRTGGGDLEERQRRLEQQLDRVMDELAQLRQEMQQLRGTGGSGAGLPPADLDQPTSPTGAESATPDFLDEPTGATEPPGFEGAGAGAARTGTSGTVSGAAGTTPVEAGSTRGPGIPPATPNR